MKKILTYGTFDLFHVGHVRLLKRLAALGDHLTVGCSTDAFNDRKNKKSVFSYAERAEILEACKYVDAVLPEEDWAQKVDDVKAHSIDVFAMGDDWAGKFDFLQDHTQVIYLPRTEGVSTTQIKDIVGSVKADKRQQILNAAASLNVLLNDL